MKKKLLALLLSGAMVISPMTNFAFASTSNKVQETGVEFEAESTGEKCAYEEEFIVSAEELGFATGLTKSMTAGIAEISDEEIPQELEEVVEETIKEASLPSAVDNTGAMGENGHTYFPGIGNQQQVGSCFSWALIYSVVTYEQNKYADRQVSDENIMSPKYGYYSQSYEGIYGPDPIFCGTKSILDVPLTNFAASSQIYSNPLNMEATEEEQLATIANSGNWYYVDATTAEGIEKLKGLLAAGEILALGGSGTVATSVIPAGYSHAGEYIAKCYLGSINHEITIVGYDDNVAVDLNNDGMISSYEKGAFKIANSWGNYSYSNKGYYWLSYDAFLADYKCEVPEGRTRVGAQDIYGFVPNHEETDFYAAVTISESERSDISIYPYFNSYGYNSQNYHNYVQMYGRYRASSSITGSNLSGGSGEQEDVIIINLGHYNNDSCDGYTELYRMYDLTKDISQVIEKHEFMLRFFDNNTTNTTGYKVKSVVFVDNVNKVSYASDLTGDVEINSNKSSSGVGVTIDKNNIVPTITSFDMTASAAGATISATAKDDASGLKYKFYVVSEDGTQTVISNYSANNTVTSSNLTDGTYKVCVDVKDADGNVVTKKINRDYESAGEKTVVYYANSNWSNAYIHYKTEKGNWTSVPGVKMNSSNEKNGYTWKYTINTGADNSVGAEVCFNNGNGSWDSNNGKNYVLGVGEYGIKGGRTEEFNSFAITSFTTSVSSPAYASDAYAMDYTATVSGEGEFRYRFGVKVNGKTYYFDENFRESNTAYGNIGTINEIEISQFFDDNADYVVAEVKNLQNGKVRTIAKRFDFKPLEVEFTHDAASTTIKVGDKVNFESKIFGEFGYRYNPHGYYVTKDGVKKSLVYGLANYSSTASWTPSEAGTYIISYEVSDYMGQSASKEITFNVIDDSANIAYVYYKTNWSNVNIHYKVEDGSWTSVPGVKMTKTDEVEGYNYVYAIDLGTKSYAIVCFNNGGNSWDSNNNSNYKVYAGNYGIKNGTVTKLNLDKTLSVKLSTDKKIGGTYNPLKFTADVTNGKAPYTYNITAVKGDSEYSITGNSKKDDTTYSYTWNSIYTAGDYDFTVTVTDADGNVATDTIKNFTIEGEKWGYFTASPSATATVGTTVTLNAEYINIQKDRYDHYSFEVIKDGNTQSLETINDHEAYWTPTEAGTYTLKATIGRYYGSAYSTTMTYEVKDNSNTVTVYYNNSNFSQANIHYQVGSGSWTSVPGVKMQASDKAGYKWMYTIELGDASYANVCFNNGSNQWDSRNGSNYRVQAGVYGIKNGSVTKL